MGRPGRGDREGTAVPGGREPRVQCRVGMPRPRCGAGRVAQARRTPRWRARSRSAGGGGGGEGGEPKVPRARSGGVGAALPEGLVQVVLRAPRQPRRGDALPRGGSGEGRGRETLPGLPRPAAGWPGLWAAGRHRCKQTCNGKAGSRVERERAGPENLPSSGRTALLLLGRGGAGGEGGWPAAHTREMRQRVQRREGGRGGLLRDAKVKRAARIRAEGGDPRLPGSREGKGVWSPS